ncbi:hypothetical protein FB451DRAFT_1484177 [Mycena latifolia]|nr:hypothetical protein FB451DRAFT_1484177 [Mycena latifolia]
MNIVVGNSERLAAVAKRGGPGLRAQFGRKVLARPPSLGARLHVPATLPAGWVPSWKGVQNDKTEVEGGGCSFPRALLQTILGTTVETLQVPHEEKLIITVIPLLRTQPMFDTFGEAIDFFSQVLEGVKFMHDHIVAHWDCFGSNIMMDGSRMFPDGFHPMSPKRKRDFYSGRAKFYTRTQRPPKYYLIDFGLSRRDTLYSTTKNKIYGFEFMKALTDDMVSGDPAKHPTIDEVVERFAAICSSLSSWQFRFRIIKVDNFTMPSRPLKDWYRKIGYILRRVPAIPWPFSQIPFCGRERLFAPVDAIKGLLHSWLFDDARPPASSPPDLPLPSLPAPPLPDSPGLSREAARVGEDLETPASSAHHVIHVRTAPKNTTDLLRTQFPLSSEAGPRTTSPRRALTRALELAREAVQLDESNTEPQTVVMAYGRSISLLAAVLERRSSDPLSRKRENELRSLQNIATSATLVEGVDIGPINIPRGRDVSTQVRDLIARMPRASTIDTDAVTLLYAKRSTTNAKFVAVYFPTNVSAIQFVNAWAGSPVPGLEKMSVSFESGNN